MLPCNRGIDKADVIRERDVEGRKKHSVFTSLSHVSHASHTNTDTHTERQNICSNTGSYSFLCNSFLTLSGCIFGFSFLVAACLIHSSLLLAAYHNEYSSFANSLLSLSLSFSPYTLISLINDFPRPIPLSGLTCTSAAAATPPFPFPLVSLHIELSLFSPSRNRFDCRFQAFKGYPPPSLC